MQPPGVLVATVAEENGISVPTLRRWLKEAEPVDTCAVVPTGCWHGSLRCSVVRSPIRRADFASWEHFVWAADQQAHFQLDAKQFQALVLGLAWQRAGSQGAISVVQR